MEISPIRIDARQIEPGPSRDVAPQELERLFATFVVKELKKTLPDGFFGQGAGSDVYEGWLEDHLGRSLADSGALDLAGSIKASIDSKTRAAEAADSAGQEPR